MKFRIILADPPWKYNSRANHKTRFRGGADGHYPLMSMDDIKALPVNDLADNQSILYLWCTFPFLKEQLEVVKAWGFRYSTVAFSWTKLNPRGYTDPREDKKWNPNKTYVLYPGDGLYHSVFFGVGMGEKCLGGDSKVFILDSWNQVKYVTLKELYDNGITGVRIHTKNGWKPINDMWRNDSTPTVKISTGVGPIVCSHNHRWFYKKVTTPRVDKKKGKRKFIHVVDCATLNEIYEKWMSHRRRGLGANLLAPKVPVESPNVLKQVEGFELDRETGWLLGLWVAEGCWQGVEDRTTMYALHEKELDFRDRIENKIDSWAMKGDRFFNSYIKVRTYFYKDRRSISVKFSSCRVKKLIQSFVQGRGAHGKRLNLERLLQTSCEFREGFLQGVLDGDGHYAKQRSWSIVLCNEGLIDDIKTLAESLGKTFKKNFKKIKGFGICGNYPYLNEVGTYVKRNKDFLKLNETPVRICDIEDNGYSETYDLSVEGEEFIVNGLRSHNSNNEICIRAYKGKVTRPLTNTVSSVILAPRRAHSRKPDEAFHKLDVMYGTDIPRIELFACPYEVNRDWVKLGYDIDGRDIRETIKEVIEI